MKVKGVSQIITLITRRYGTQKSYSTAALSLTAENYEEIVTECYPRPYSEIPGPKQLPIIGNSWRFAPIIGHYKIRDLDKVMWSLYEEYGKIVKVGGLIGHPDLLFVFDGDNIQKIFRQEEHMPHRPSMPSLHYYKERLQKDFFEGHEGVIGIHGPKWDRFRKQVQQIMLTPSTAKSFVKPLDEIASDFLKRMEESLDENDELPENFLFEIYKWALESVARVSLDTRLGCLEPNLPKDSESQKIIDSINTFFWNVAEVELKMPIWRIYKNKAFRKYIGALEDFRTLCMRNISRAMTAKSNSNAVCEKEGNVSILERILKKTGSSKVAAVLALDLLLVGVDTTSIAVASTLYQLAINPEMQEKLFKELNEALPDSDTAINEAALEKLHYLKACIKETLRMYPVIIGNGRSLTSDTIIEGYMVPKGYLHSNLPQRNFTSGRVFRVDNADIQSGRNMCPLVKFLCGKGTHVIFPHLVVSNITKYFKNPNEFLPERWLKLKDGYGGCKHANKIHPFVSLPFGYGRRSCLGRRFAEIELQILLAKIFRKYKVEYHHEPFTYKITPTYVPEQPLKFRLIQRNN